MAKKYLTFDKKRPVSWSFKSSFDYDPEQWWEKYVLHGKCTKEFCTIANGVNLLCPVVKTIPEMLFGKDFADSIEDGTCKVKSLMKVLQKKKEYPFRCFLGKIELIGFGDAFCEETFKKLDEVKTGVKEWTQKRADEHRQIDMYLLQNWIMHKIRPEDVENTLHWVPTERSEDGRFRVTIKFKEPIKVHSFKTKRTMADILKFAADIENTLVKMEEYCKNHA